MTKDEDAVRGWYFVALTDDAKASLQRVRSKKDSLSIHKLLDILDTVPGIGRLYNPAYKAAIPRIPSLQVVYAGHFGIYYIVDEDARQVNILFIEDQRRNPLSRFLGDGDT